MSDSQKRINKIISCVDKMASDTARKCGCREDEVWHVISLHPHFTSKQAPFFKQAPF